MSSIAIRPPTEKSRKIGVDILSTAFRNRFSDGLQMAEGGKFLVCAIDFGTTYSGWGYSFKREFESDPTKISLKRWYSVTETLTTVKTPTCALIAPDGKTLVEFGYAAENEYQKLAEQGQHENYYYFQRFKMALAKQSISRDLVIKDEMGKSLQALKVFALSIGYLASDVIENLQKSITGDTMKKSDIHWVLTVPAIWSDAAKQFMREAAKEAQIDMEKLAIVYEPEAASVYCQYVPVRHSTRNLEISKMPVGTQYLILDAGGGTIDITVHQVNASGGLKEVHKASGGGWGGTLVDKAFEDLLRELFGSNVYDKFVKKATDDWLDLRRLFEIRKRNLHRLNEEKIAMKCPLALKEIVEQETNKTLIDIINASKFSDKIQVRKDKLLFSSSLIRSLFDYAIQTTLSHVRSILEHESVKNNEMILMVGGFSDSCLLRNAVENEFKTYKLIVPPDPSTAILCGAVIIGHNPKSISERKLKKTYGVKMFLGRFDKHVEKGQTVIVGEAQQTRTYWPVLRFISSTTIQFYASDLNDPKCIDEDCELVGEMIIDLSDLPNEEKNFEVKITFSDTEITATAKVLKTGNEINAKFNFLD